MSFASQLARFSGTTQNKVRNVYRGASLDLFSAIVIATPVKQGVLRGAWHVDFNTAIVSTTTEVSINSRATIAKIEEKMEGVKIDDVVYFSNNTPYADPIEYDGISGKAPEGMVRINTIRWDRFVKANIRKFK